MSDAKLQQLKRKACYDPAYRNQWMRACLRIDTLPKFQLMTSHSNLCKTGQFPVNHFAGIRNNIAKDLGSEVVAYFHDWQPKATHILEDQIRVSHDPEGNLGEWTIWVQSTSVNRKLLAKMEVLYDKRGI